MPLSIRDQLISKLVTKLTDWLVVILGVSVILWFFIRLPVFPVTEVRQTSPLVSQNKLKSHVRTLVEDYSPRTIEYGNLNITAHYIHRELDNFGDVHYQPYWTLAGRFSNVVLSLGPDTKEVLVIGAHYDAESDSLDVEGNASGIATLIELARHLSNNEAQLGIKVSLVAYPLSQKGKENIENMGSYNHADLLKTQNEKVKLMVSLDGVGRFNSESKSQKYPYRFMRFFYPSKGDYISLIARLQDYSIVLQLKESFSRSTRLPLYSFNAPQDFSPTTSLDHINYQKSGFPAVLISDTANYRKIVGRTPGDIIEQLDYEKMSMLVEGLFHVVMDNKSEIKDAQYVQQVKILEETINTSSDKTVEKGGGVL